MAEPNVESYRVRQVAQRYQIPLSTLYTWKKRGKLRTHKVGGIVLIPRSEVERLFGGVSND